MEGVLKYKLGADVPPTRPLAENFLYTALTLVNAYKSAKIQLPSSINYGDMAGVPK